MLPRMADEITAVPSAPAEAPAAASPALAGAARGPAATLRLLVAGAVLAALLLGAALVSAAAAQGARAPRRPPAKARLCAIQPAIQRHPALSQGATRAGAAGRALLGFALMFGVAAHLARAPRVRLAATGAALGACTWALGSAVERGLRPAEATWLALTLGGQTVALTPWDLCLGAALVVALGAGAAGAVARRGAPAAPAPDGAAP
jgi:hypothetical protein